MFDLLVKNGTIIDGTGAKAINADIAIIGDKITEIGTIDASKAKKVIDAKGFTVCPGIVDVHCHTDATIPIDARSISQVRQGVTTYIGGLCGFSLAPTVKGNSPDMQIGAEKVVATWSDFDSYLKAMDKLSHGINFGAFVGHGTLRKYIMENPIGQPSEQELKQMQEELDASIKSGAFGISTGLEYNPGKASTMAELEALCSIVQKHDGLHTVHTRNRDFYYLSALAEVIDITKRTNVRLQISHINPKYGCHDTTMDDLLNLIQRTRKQGFEVTVDVMPSEWNHTNTNALLPLWAQNLSDEELLKLLKSPEGRAKLSENQSPIWQLAHQGKWDRIFHFGGIKTADLQGKSIEEIAKEKNISGWDTLCWLLEEDYPNYGASRLTSNAFSLEDIATALKEPYSSVVSDVMGLSNDGPLANEVFSPNTYDWVPVFFENFVFSKSSLLSLEEGIMKLTSIPAKQIQLEKRGSLVKGNYADIALFDFNNFKRSATLKNPSLYPNGVEMVIINGKISYTKGNNTIACNGKVLRFKHE